MDVIHAAIAVDDVDAMRSFYVDALGLDEHGSFTFDGVENVYVGGERGEIQFRYDPERTESVDPDREAFDHVAVGVDDVDAVLDSLVAETGCPVVDGPITVERAGARVAFVEDPQGYVLELVEEL